MEETTLELTTGGLSFFRFKFDSREYTLSVPSGCDAEEALYMLERFKEEVSKFIKPETQEEKNGEEETGIPKQT